MSDSIIKDKKILAVDDEPDVLDVIKELLYDSRFTAAEDYETARRLLEREDFDLVILDIMGVNGFELLELCSRRGLPAAMLTARSTDVRSLNQSLKLGAVSFLPKEELASLREIVAEILEDLAQGKSHWKKLFLRLGPLFKKKFGIVWDQLEKPDRMRIPYD
ncbi:MAG: response regulator [Desulfomonilaceae bacterium]